MKKWDIKELRKLFDEWIDMAGGAGRMSGFFYWLEEVKDEKKEDRECEHGDGFFLRRCRECGFVATDKWVAEQRESNTPNKPKEECKHKWVKSPSRFVEVCDNWRKCQAERNERLTHATDGVNECESWCVVPNNAPHVKCQR